MTFNKLVIYVWCETTNVLEMNYPSALIIDLLCTTLIKYNISLNK